ncbi:MAG TPA: N-acyl homoserine lactonase family protein [Pseudonocardia sp.]
MAIPGTATRMWALDAPKLTVDKSLLMVGASGECTVPLPAFLIEHPKGLVLFDTGLAPAAATDPFAVYGELANHFDMSFSPDLTLDNQLKGLGYKLSDVKYVVASHTHFDHTGGLYLFPEARLYVGEGDIRYAFWPDPAGAGFFRQADLEATRGFNWQEIPSCDHDIFGDGSLVILWTPGHTPGELSMLVRLPGRNFILTGDTVHLREQLESAHPMGTDANTQEAVRSIRRLQLLRDSADATVWISHDPEDWDEFKPLHCYE